MEGPEDATELIPALTDEDAVPPIALLAWRTDRERGTALWPFASYSPEYAALSWARANGRRARFVDLPSGSAILPNEEDPTEGAGVDAFADVAEARGQRSFEEFWEADFEAPAHSPDGFRAAITAWADLVREGPSSRRQWHRARDAWMWRHAQAESGTVLLVAGAAHVAALAVGDVEPELVKTIAPPVPTGLTLVPFSYTRLAEQTGYGAGNRAPRYYQRAHDAGCDYGRATLEVLVEFAGELRLRGHSASLADVIEAWRLARSLTELRGKVDPGLDEVREAAVATMCRGDKHHVDTLLWPTMVGQAIGKVPARVGRNALQDEFWREVEARRLPKTDSDTRFTLQLVEPFQVATSVFLHRLRISDIPYASFLAVSQSGRPDKTMEAGGQDALQRTREVWEARWTPATDVELVTAIVHGDTLVAVAARKLGERLAAARGTGDTADVLMEAVVCDVPAVSAEALVACELRAVDDDDVLSLARAARALANLVRFGSSRRHLAAEETLAALRDKVYARALLRVAGACVGNDEAVAPARSTLRILHEVAADREGWRACAESIMNDGLVHPACAGLAAGLLYIGGTLSEADLAHRIAYRLTGDPVEGAGFLEGVLDVNAMVLCRSRPIVAALDAYLATLDKERFPELVPVLRRAFASLGATERRYLLENVLQLRKVEEVSEAKAILDEKDTAALDGLMDDLDDLL